MKYLLMANGKVAHIELPESFVRYPGQMYGYYKTVCGRHITSGDFEGGILPLGDSLPAYLSLCKKCAKSQGSI
jgi:hypothetical protein